MTANITKPTVALTATAALVFNAAVWGMSWWPLRQLQDQGLHPLWSTTLIYLVVLMLLLCANFKSLRGMIEHPALWLLALVTGLTNVCFNWAVTEGDVVRVVLLFYMMPAWSVLVSWWLLGEKPSAPSLLRLLLAMTGVLIVLKTPETTFPIPQSMADWLAITGGLCFAITNALLRKLNYTPNGSRMLAMFGGGALMAGGTALLGMQLAAVNAPTVTLTAIPVALGLGLAFFLGNAALQYGAARLSASATALVMLTEILFASLSAVALGAGDFTPRILIGGSLIVLAAMLSALLPGKAAPRRNAIAQ
jgi:drug/metabolite transporter (DMT)-like permease